MLRQEFKLKFAFLVVILIGIGMSGISAWPTLISVALMVIGTCLYHWKPAWERRTAANGHSFLELVPVWELRERMLRRAVVICVGAWVGALIATRLIERAPG